MLIYFLVFIIGISTGSFLNVVALRGLSNESIIFPNSKCPTCQHALYWWHKIPILSYILLKRKCWFCGEKISFQYPFIELLTGILFILTYLKFGVSIKSLFLLFVISGLLVLALTDFKKNVIIGWHAYILIVLGLVYHLINNSFIISLTGLVGGIGIMFILSKLGYLISKTKPFGEGDFLILGSLGSVFGVQALIPILIYSIVLEIFWTIPQFIKKLLSQRDFLTILLLILFITFSILIYKTEYYANMYIKYIILILFMIIGGLTCYRVLKSTKSKRIKVPFGPAITLSGLIYIFFVL